MTGRAPRVAVIAVGDPESPGTWSGITASLLGALRGLGVEALGLDLELPRMLERALLLAGAARTMNRCDAHGAPLAIAVRSARARAGLRDAKLDGAIQIGSTFELPQSLPYVTLEDMTVAQAVADHPVFQHMSRRGMQRWERRRLAIYRQAGMCTTGSAWAARSLSEDYDVPQERIGVVGFGANHRLTPLERSWHPPRFLFVGVDWERKGGPSVLQAFARVREAEPEARLDLVGKVPDVDMPGVVTHGRLSLGEQDDRATLAKLFSEATCLVMPSTVEPFGIVYVEAATGGIPSIGTSVGGAPEAIGEGGVVVNPGDDRGLLEAMRRMCDPSVARELGDAARHASRRYSWTKVAERLLRALGLDTPDGRELSRFL